MGIDCCVLLLRFLNQETASWESKSVSVYKTLQSKFISLPFFDNTLDKNTKKKPYKPGIRNDSDSLEDTVVCIVYRLNHIIHSWPQLFKRWLTLFRK